MATSLKALPPPFDNEKATRPAEMTSANKKGPQHAATDHNTDLLAPLQPSGGKPPQVDFPKTWSELVTNPALWGEVRELLIEEDE